MQAAAKKAARKRQKIARKARQRAATRSEVGMRAMDNNSGRQPGVQQQWQPHHLQQHHHQQQRGLHVQAKPMKRMGRKQQGWY